MSKRRRKFQHYIFDPKRARRAVNFIERFCFLNKGFAGKPFKMIPFHRECTEELFGWIDAETGKRRYRRAYISTARKNAKSTWSAGVANYCLFADEEPSPEVICAANARHQAEIVFQACVDQITPSPTLSQLVKIIPSTKRILYPDKNGILKCISADATTEIGGNISCLIYDEISFAPSKDLFDAVTSGSGTRQQPLKIFITTAGFDMGGVGFDLYEQAKEIEANPELDPTFLVRIKSIPTDLDWTDEKNWPLANPALGDFLQIDELRENYREAGRSASGQNKFRVLHCNQWVQAAKSWLDVAKWDACEDPDFDESQLAGMPCHAAVDLSSKVDLTAMALIFPLADGGRYYLKPFFFIPDADLRARVIRDHVPYDGWIEQKHVIATPGEMVDYSFIRAKLNELAGEYKIQSVGFDPWNSGPFVQSLQEGFECVPIRQGHQSLGEPTKEFEALINSGKIVHLGNPCMRWNVSNVTTRQDANGNIVPDKKRSRHRIDGVAAAIMALDRCLRQPGGSAKPARELKVHVLG